MARNKYSLLTYLSLFHIILQDSKRGRVAVVKNLPADLKNLPSPHFQSKLVSDDDAGAGSNPYVAIRTATTFECGYAGCKKIFQLRTSANRHQIKDHGRKRMKKGRQNHLSDE